jgi:hypothetical protein
MMGLRVIWEVEEDTLVQPSNLGYLFSFLLLWREGKVGDHIVDAFLEEWQQFFRLVSAI